MVRGQTEIPGIALDIAASKMYWSVYSGGVIERSNLDGTGQEIVLSGLSGPSFIALQLGTAPVPEPEALVLLGVAAVGWLTYCRLRRKKVA